MYARRVEDKTLTFAVSGMLWQRSLVMVDSETKSLWSHLLGLAMRGPLKGQSLNMLPSTMTDWKTWRRQHPDTTVLMMSRTSRDYRREFYADPAKFVIGMAASGQARAWPFDQLVRHRLVNDQFRDVPVLVLMDVAIATAVVYERRVGKEILEFAWDRGQLIDQQTQSVWDAWTGRATRGPMKGRQLPAALAIVSYRQAWSNFHPDSTYWSHRQ